MGSSKKSDSNRKLATCPHIAIGGSPDVRLGYPSPNNFCYQAEPPAPVKEEYQDKVCLCAEYVNCPVYKAVEKKQLPDELRRSHRSQQPAQKSTISRQKKTVRSNWLYLLPIVVLAILALAAAQWRSQQNAAIRNAFATSSAVTLTSEVVEANTQLTSTAEAIANVPTATATATQVPSATPEPTATATVRATATPEPTATQTATATPEPTATAPPRPTATPSPTTEPTATPVVFQAEVLGNRVGIRRGPSEDYSVIVRSDIGDEWEIIGRNETGTWLQLCCIEDDEVGWTLARLLGGEIDITKLPVVLAPGAKAVADLNPLPIYAGPFYSYEQIGFVPIDTVFDLIGRDQSGQWWQICCIDGMEGWVYFETVELDGSADDLPIVDRPPSDSE